MNGNIDNDEKRFCEKLECSKNKADVYHYISEDGLHHLNLPFILLDYKEWLIKNGIVKSN